MSPTMRSVSGRSTINSTRTSSSRMATRVSWGVAEMRISRFIRSGRCPERREPAQWSRRADLAQQVTGDDQPLDLAGPFADLADLGVPQDAFDRMLVQQPLGAQELDGGAGGPAGELAGGELRHGRGVAVRPTLLAEPRGVVDEVAGGRDLGRQVRQAELRALRVAETQVAGRGDGQDGVERALGETEGERADADAARVECAHEVDEALTFLAQPVLHGNLGVLQDQLARVRGAPAHLVFLLARPDAGGERLQLGRVPDADALRRLP